MTDSRIAITAVRPWWSLAGDMLLLCLFAAVIIPLFIIQACLLAVEIALEHVLDLQQAWPRESPPSRPEHLRE